MREALFAGFQAIDRCAFYGASKDPTKTQLGLSSVETIFLLINYLDDQNVTCALFMLKNDAELWSKDNLKILSQNGSVIQSIYFLLLYLI